MFLQPQWNSPFSTFSLSICFSGKPCFESYLRRGWFKPIFQIGKLRSRERTLGQLVGSLVPAPSHHLFTPHYVLHPARLGSSGGFRAASRGLGGESGRPGFEVHKAGKVSRHVLDEWQSVSTAGALFTIPSASQRARNFGLETPKHHSLCDSISMIFNMQE